MSQRPRVIDGQVTVRDVLDLTVAIDHNVVDGAPAARFAAEFRDLLESAAVISPSSVALPAQGDQQAGPASGAWMTRRVRPPGNSVSKKPHSPSM